MMLAQMGLSVDANLVEALLDETGLPALIENWQEVAHHLVQRLRAEATRLGGDPWLGEMADRLAGRIGAAAPGPGAGSEAVIPTRYRLGDMTLSFFSTISQFSTAEDIALADWKIEHLFPADEATRDIVVALARDMSLNPMS
jgi:hypothetical protein